jgi:uncharacterized membrane protein YdbT with pleckstrin-like domain
MACPTRLLSSGEHVETQFRPHWRAVLRPVFLVLVAIATAILGYMFTDGTLRLVVYSVAGFVILGGATVPLTKWWFTSYVINNERLITRSGVFSRRGQEIPLEVINDISFSQSFGERIFRSGDLVIESAGEHGQSRYSDVPDPEGLQAHVYRLREARIRDLAQPTATEHLERLAILYRRGVLTKEEFESKKLLLVEEQDSDLTWSSRRSSQRASGL